MSTVPQVRAAQYVRASTDHQEYSATNQMSVIAEYAERNGFSIIKTYDDPATSGVVLRLRKGLQNLIKDVVQGEVSYKAILVYDVSRWGRFQDADESAYYEFLCKSAGVRVHYCGEAFPNDDSLPAMMMKALKRIMAGEYSRELGVKILSGQRRGASLGFHQGAKPGYGLRRFLVSADGTAKQVLANGERKSIATDRVILVPGPPEEIECVHQIYQMFIAKKMTFTEISRDLNRRGMKYIQGSEWCPRAVRTILTHPKYMGCNVYGRYTQRLYTRIKPKPRSEWVFTPEAFKPLVDPAVFGHAQQIINGFTWNRSDQDLLESLRSTLGRYGKLTTRLLQRNMTTPCGTTYRVRFGTLSHAYELIGYSGSWPEEWLQARRRIQTLRTELINKIVELNPTRIIVENRGYKYRARLRTNDGMLVSVLASRPVRCYKDAIRWLVKPRNDERNLITLVARLSLQCDSFKDMFLIPAIGSASHVYLKDRDQRLENYIKVTGLENFCGTIERLRHRKSRV
jgi:DNA invertase Pin-like site-specific DNA recombinase